ncbi:unnamed protein product [Darwinula stevensoni]|uniref:Leucine carboxyl methyltransferase 1 n=1 Tax=Darwinula stevensoni TaxID=69355 RepID=A0A7R9FR58_9CRUS|nr:unnamed protein product [Darwinula stevensoni]CAG0900809.1 unnamed protein product [Darwinula stevensoni]
MSLPGDEAVIATNDDAAQCKKSAVDLGYWVDPFLGSLVRHTSRKLPEINRGYYARVAGIETLIKKFIDKFNGKCQLVNIGAGFDTLYWRLQTSGHKVNNYIEVDLPTVTSRKISLLKKVKELHHTEFVTPGSFTCDMHAKDFHIIGADIRKVHDVQIKMDACNIDTSIPTLFIAECVLVYLSIKDSTEFLKWIASTFKCAFFINYEQVNLSDTFGEMMIRNLHDRGCALAGADACMSLDAQKHRFLESGWDGAEGWDMQTVYANLLPKKEIDRIEKIEFLDEKELLVQLLTHYCISVAWLDKLNVDFSCIRF